MGINNIVSGYLLLVSDDSQLKSKEYNLSDRTDLFFS